MRTLICTPEVYIDQPAAWVLSVLIIATTIVVAPIIWRKVGL